MAFYPILIELQGAPCLVAGGGALALYKAKLLLEQGAQVRVVAPELERVFAVKPCFYETEDGTHCYVRA